MKKIKPSLCTACGVFAQEYESNRWPLVRACHYCYKRLVDFMLVEGYADSNVFFFHLVEIEDGNKHPYWMDMHDGSRVLVCMGPSKYDSSPHVFGTWHVAEPIVNVESENKSNNPLDNL